MNMQISTGKGIHPAICIAGKVILYTGAAGGLGTATTLSFLRAGAKVVAIDNNPEKVESLIAAAARENLQGLTVRALDLSDLKGLRVELDRVSAEVGGFDIVINNAAIYPSKNFEDYTIEEFQAVQCVNVDAGIVCVQAALSHMRAQGWGRIVNIASVTVYGGWSHLAPYVQSKGALVGLTRAWAREFGAYGVTVNAVSPGAFPTDAEKIHSDPESYTRFVLDHQAIKRRGDACDIANALTFLISDAAGFITGQTLNVDGGWVMH
ncbi:SDR family oxidoreductase [Sinorhizobium medicae]|uniref:Short-chain dehydrogenase/reductase SDR n=2 Tax=Sinorhizobium medicae TaxID=110321 RepID=A6ULD1_SINMW|nr:SDR family oxidoreductase [Sinorhizobium medicae]ABR64461.1 short-chain dehydrogenase/reductase SDR [Sinorhizobium medicae WSM419]MDX0408145.1 SDR family oxidoreductase [Sinorhizobium medicae]MDX0414675.1 SDR family oxidoreductase [Sinorhizobium medicae]MDX0420075.1 SDR family oxidoreductase [Sinorhizobium medicae]MDX0436358.1 SDR family oxidoreductase [Sinorhizobium medicae]